MRVSLIGIPKMPIWIEIGSGIGSNVGGAVAMNAGTNQGETFDDLVSLTVLEEGVFDAWEQEASRMASIAYDPDDTEAQWAWDWKD